MSILAAVQNIDDDAKGEVNSLGSSGPIPSGLYPATITMAYMRHSPSGALGLHLQLKLEDGQEFRKALYVTSGDAKGNRTVYVNKRGEEVRLPGYNVANSICLLTVGKELGKMETEEKILNIFSPEAGKEVPTKMDVMVELLDQQIIAGIIRQTVDKTTKDDAGNYVRVPGETRIENEVDKIFRAKDNMTTVEIIGGAEEATWIDAWKEKWDGKDRDRSTPPGADAANPFQGKAANDGATAKPTKSLFNPK